MIKLFGKNNNSLIKKSNKQTYSMPQSLSFPHQIRKSACGFDYMALVTTANMLYFLFEGHFYLIENLADISDISTSENTVSVVTVRGEVFVWDFDYEKIQQGIVNYTSVNLNLEQNDRIQKVEMGGNDIFLLSQQGRVYHFKRNQWYETKTFSNVQSIELSQKIVQISSGQKENLFLTYEGEVFTSSKLTPLNLQALKTSYKFIKIASSSYCAGITKKGVIMIWGKSIHGNNSHPTQFSKLTKKFINIKLQAKNGFAIADDGQIWVWGANEFGELGLSDYETRTKPFPMITLQNYSGIQICCGDSYTCCICYPNDKESVKIVDRKKETFRCSQNICSIPNKNKQKSDEKVHKKSISSDKFRNEHRRSTSKMNQKSLEKSKNQTPNNKSSKKNNCFPASKTQKTPPKSAKHKNHNKINTNSIDMKIIPYQFHHSSPQIQSERVYEQLREENKNLLQSNQMLQKENQTYKDQSEAMKEDNIRLREKVSSQNQIITDITMKIRLLEEAIDEYEKNLTARDHLVDQFEKKEENYIRHINELQSKMDDLIHSMNSNNQVTVVYENMKEDFNRERQYYLEKLKKFEEVFDKQRQSYLNENQLLRWQVAKYKQTNLHSPLRGSNKENTYWGHSPINKRGMEGSDMENMIEKIEQNKNRINKSANKLIAMLDMSN